MQNLSVWISAYKYRKKRFLTRNINLLRKIHQRRAIYFLYVFRVINFPFMSHASLISKERRVVKGEECVAGEFAVVQQCIQFVMGLFDVRMQGFSVIVSASATDWRLF